MIRIILGAFFFVALSSMSTVRAGIVFEFDNSSTTLGSIFDGQSSAMGTVSGLTITMTANVGTFNATAGEFGISQPAAGDDTDGFDVAESGTGTGVAEGFSFSFDQDVTLMSFDVSSISTRNDDMIDVSSGGTNIATVGTTGATSLGNTFVAAGTNIDVITTGGVYGNGWTLDFIEVNVAAVPEPTTLTLFGSAVGFLLINRRKKRLLA